MTVDGAELYPVHLSWDWTPLSRIHHLTIAGFNMWSGKDKADVQQRALAVVAKQLGVEVAQLLPLIA